MAQAKKKTATKTAKKPAARARQSSKRVSTRTAKRQEISSQEKMHVYLVTAMSIVAGILLFANAAMMMV